MGMKDGGGMELEVDERNGSYSLAPNSNVPPSRSMNVIWARHEQVKRWQGSDTDKASTKNKSKKEKRSVRFPEGCVFLAACAAGDQNEVETLLDNGADINTVNVDGLTALHQAVIDENLLMVQFLVEHDAHIDAQDNEGWTALHAAVSCSFPDIVRYLLDSGADLTVVNNDAELPHDLADNNDMKYLLDGEIMKKNIDINKARRLEEDLMMDDAMDALTKRMYKERTHPKTGATPLHVATCKGYTKVMSILIQSGASVNVVDNEGWTPLHAACHWGLQSSCDILAENMADFQAVNQAGETCFDVCDEDILPFVRELHEQQTLLRQQQKSPTVEIIRDIKSPTENRPRKPSISSGHRHSTQDKIKITKQDEIMEAKELRGVKNEVVQKDLSPSPSPPKSSPPKETPSVVVLPATPVSPPVTPNVPSSPQVVIETPKTREKPPPISIDPLAKVPKLETQTIVVNSTPARAPSPTENSRKVLFNGANKEEVKVACPSEEIVTSNYCAAGDFKRPNVPPISTTNAPQFEQKVTSDPAALVSPAEILPAPSWRITGRRAGSVTSPPLSPQVQSTPNRKSSMSVTPEPTIVKWRCAVPEVSPALSEPPPSRHSRDAQPRRSKEFGRKGRSQTQAPATHRKSYGTNAPLPTRPLGNRSLSSLGFGHPPKTTASDRTTTGSLTIGTTVPSLTTQTQDHTKATLVVQTSPLSTAQRASFKTSPGARAGAAQARLSLAPVDNGANDTVAQGDRHGLSPHKLDSHMKHSHSNNIDSISPGAVAATSNRSAVKKLVRTLSANSPLVLFAPQIVRDLLMTPQIKTFSPTGRRDESESERKAHSRRARESRRSTQGITLEQLKSAEQMFQESKTGQTQAQNQTQPQTKINNNNNNNNNNIAKDSDQTSVPSWRSSTLKQSTTVATNSCDLSSNETPTSSRPPRPTAVTFPAVPAVAGNYDSQVASDAPSTPNRPIETPSTATPSAAGLISRRKQRPTRRSTGPVAQHNAPDEDIDENSKHVNGNSTGVKNVKNQIPVDGKPKSLSGYSNRYNSTASTGSVSSASRHSSQASLSSQDADLDYKKLYEEKRDENDILMKRIEALEADMATLAIRKEPVCKTPNTISTTVSDRERRAMQRKIAELEEDVKKMDQLRADNQRLKEENGALIRVISKLSK